MVFSKVFPLLLLLAFSVNASGQSPVVTDVSVGMLTWAKHLDNGLDKYFSREKADELNEHLKYLEQDLRAYMKTRKTLSDSLFRNNIAPGKKDNEHLEILKTEMSAVMRQMRDVTDLVGRELQAEGDKLNNEIYNVLYGEEGRYLSSLEAFLAGGDVTKRDLAVEGSKSYERLEACVNIITVLQRKIDKKMGR
jgi:hypothetical protein